jgi:hypothetical protein
MPLQIRLDGHQGIACGRRYPLDVHGVLQGGQDAGRPPRPQAVPRPGKPPTGWGGPPLSPGCRRLPALLCGRVKISSPQGMARAALLQEAPAPSAPIPAPANLRGARDPVAPRFEPQAGSEGIAVSPYRPPPALAPPGHHPPGPRARLPHTGQHAPFDGTPARLALGRTGRRPTRPPHPIGSQRPWEGRPLRGPWLWHDVSPWGHGVPRLLQVRHGVVASRVPPPPHGAGAHSAPPVPAQQARRGHTRPKDGPGPAPRLELPARPLRRLPPQPRISGSSLRDRTAPGTTADAALPPAQPHQAGELARGTALAPP